MDRQTLRDWVIRFNERGPQGLLNTPSPGASPKLKAEHKAFLSRLVAEGPIPAVHRVVRRRACDLVALVYEEFGLAVSDDTIYRALKGAGLCPCEREAEGLPAGWRGAGGVQKTYGPSPVRKRNRFDVLKRSASMYPACSRSSAAPGHDGYPRALVLINFTASGAIF
jgi:transposase